MELNIKLKNIEENLIELSDSQIQKQRWLNLNNESGLISSYDELYNSLFDDNQIEYFIKNELYIICNDIVLLKEFESLIQMLNEYNEPEEYLKSHNDKYIIDDINWDKITKQSKIVLKLWQQKVR